MQQVYSLQSVCGAKMTVFSKKSSTVQLLFTFNSSAVNFLSKVSSKATEIFEFTAVVDMACEVAAMSFRLINRLVHDKLFNETLADNIF